MALNLEHLLRTAATLEQALLAIERTPPDAMVMFDLFRKAAIKASSCRWKQRASCCAKP